MIINHKTGEVPSLPPYEVTVDGEAIRYPWYVDTEAGIVKTYDLAQNGDHPVHPAFFDPNQYPTTWEIEPVDPGYPMSRVIRGHVEIKPR